MAMPLETLPIGRRRVLAIFGGGLAFGSSTGFAMASRGGSELSHQLSKVRADTRKYRDVGAARADGFEPLLGYFPAMGFHFTDRDPPLGADRNDPPLLVYYPTGNYTPDAGDAHDPAHDDDLVLGAVEYLVSGDQSDNPPDIFADEKSSRALRVTEEEGWHFEHDLDVTGLHAWLHRGNPAGVFHSTNPGVL